MIDHINRTRECHIVTIEDPIEVLHQDELSAVSQREVGFDTASFLVALRSALREDPDVILVGEMRDVETVETALSAAETGHLVFATLHTIDCVETINRIVDFFPSAQQRQARLSLAGALKGTLCQRLMPTADGSGRVPALEIMITNGRIQQCIIEPGQGGDITSIIREGEYYGMQTFDQALVALLEQGTIDLRSATQAASNPHDLRVALQKRGLVGSAARGTEPPRSLTTPAQAWTIGAPKSTVMTVPAARNGPKGIFVRRCTLCSANSNGGRHTGDDEADQETGDDLAVADPAEEGSAQAGEANITEADALRHGEKEREEGAEGGGTADRRRSRAPTSGVCPPRREPEAALRGAAVAYTIVEGMRRCSTSMAEIATRGPEQAIRGELPGRGQPPGEQHVEDPRPELQQRVPGRDVHAARPAAPPEEHIGDDGDVVVGTNGRRTGDAVRRGQHDRLVTGDAVDDDADERTDEQADNAGDRLQGRMTSGPRCSAPQDALARARARRSPARVASWPARPGIAQLATLRS